MRTLIGLAMAAALVIAGCCSADEPAAPKNPRDQAQKILDAVGAAADAERTGDITWFGADNLYEYVDGMAAYYVDSGFVLLAHSEWRPRGSKGPAYVELDLYDMGSPEGALDVLGDSRRKKTMYLEIGNEAHQTNEGVDFRVGRYYAKLVARKDAKGQMPLARALAEAVAKAVPPGPSDENLVAPLPAEQMIPHTAAYTTKTFLGREFLNGVREAAYTLGDNRVRLLAMDAASADKAAAVMAAWKASAPTPTPVKDLPDAFSYREAYVGTFTVARKGQWLLGAIGDPDAAQELLKPLIARLE